MFLVGIPSSSFWRTQSVISHGALVACCAHLYYFRTTSSSFLNGEYPIEVARAVYESLTQASIFLVSLS